MLLELIVFGSNVDITKNSNLVILILGATGLTLNPVHSCIHGTCHKVQVISTMNDEEKRELTESFNCQCSGKYSGEFCEIPFDHCAGNFVSLTPTLSERIWEFLLV